MGVEPTKSLFGNLWSELRRRRVIRVVAIYAVVGWIVIEVASTVLPNLNLPEWSVKILKPQSIVEMLHAGSRDVGFAGADWVAELDGDLVELADTGLDPVLVVAAAPTSLAPNGVLPEIPLVIASE